MDNGASSYRRFLEGDDRGIVEVIRDHKDGLILFLNRYVNDLHIAEELTEETFFRLVTKRPRFTANGSFKTWLYTIGRNLSLNYIKRNRKISDTPIDEISGVSSDMDMLEHAYLCMESKILLNKALSQIRKEYSVVLHLKYFEDMTNEQIARILKKNKRQIENLLYQAKHALKKELEKEGFEYEGLY